MNIQGNYNTQFNGRLHIYLGNTRDKDNHSLRLVDYDTMDLKNSKEYAKELKTYFVNEKHAEEGTLYSDGIIMDTKNIMSVSDAGISYYFPNLDTTKFLEFKKALNGEQYARFLTAINVADNLKERSVTFDALS